MRAQTVVRGLVCGVAACLGLLLSSRRVEAQPQVCGDGTTFTVSLPSVADGPGDSVTLPSGCRVYALLVSGFARNGALDELVFYDLAHYVLQQDGYVHWAWWNNLLKEYMARPLHRTETYRQFPTDLPLGPNPGDPLQVSTLVPGAPRWKAVPEEDTQFQADALRMVQAIRSRHPDAVVIVAGHSMGGASVARLGTNASLPPIDLLAPIDPVGNRSDAVGQIGSHTYNWTRWRATHRFRGYRSVDCERNAAGLCRNVGTFLNPSYNCQPVGPWQLRPALAVSLAPLYCPGRHVDPGTRLSMHANVRRLYHRWQTEAEFPFDFTSQYLFQHRTPLDNSSLLTSRNVQRAVLRNAALEKDPDKTCSVGFDPRDSSRLCSASDGHGEIVGLRAPTPGQPGGGVPVAPIAIAARQWPAFDQSQPNGHATFAERRHLLIEMKTATASWTHRPIDPGLCMVSADMRAIVEHLLGDIPSEPAGPPVTTIDVSPSANAAGWHNDDVVLSFVPVGASGRTVTGLTVTLTGATNDVIETDGRPAEILVNREGTTVASWSARDGLSVETPQSLTIRLDRTPPIVVATASPVADVQGWHHDDATVTFTATDTGSGVATVTAPVTVTTEGAGQEIVGMASDVAGNVAAAAITVNLDRQRVTGAQSGQTWLLAEGAANAIFTAEIQIGNPSAESLDVTIRLLPQADASFTAASRAFTVAPTSRFTVALREDFGLIGSSSFAVSAVIAGTETPADVVVERTMSFPGPGATATHNAGGVLRASPSWTLAEGATTFFDTFVLVANVNATPTLVRATYLTASGGEYVSEQIAPPESRLTFWPKYEHPALWSAEFSTVIDSLTPGNDVVAERAMYFNGFNGGHDALGIPSPRTTWYFAEGFTGGNTDAAFETFLLLVNTGEMDATVSVDYLLDTGDVVSRAYAVPARRRVTVWVDAEGRSSDLRLANGAFGIRLTADRPVVAERAMYWGTPSTGDRSTPMFPWREGHVTGGIDSPSSRWAFAEGGQGVLGAAGQRHDTFILVANPNPVPIAVRATFYREDGRGVVQEVCVPANTRTNIWTATVPALVSHRFATVLESVASAPCDTAGGERFVAERAVYVGSAGHVNVGTPWPTEVATPPPPE